MRLNIAELNIMSGFKVDDNMVNIMTYVDGKEVSVHESISAEVKNVTNDLVKKGENGLIVKYSLQSVISEVIVHPLASDAYFNKIKSDIKNAGLNIQVTKSSIAMS